MGSQLFQSRRRSSLSHVAHRACGAPLGLAVYPAGLQDGDQGRPTRLGYIGPKIIYMPRTDILFVPVIVWSAVMSHIL